jgi:hypothetical protein
MIEIVGDSVVQVPLPSGLLLYDTDTGRKWEIKAPSPQLLSEFQQFAEKLNKDAKQK